MNSKNDISSLPKWAQRELGRLLDLLEYRDRKIAQLTEAPPSSIQYQVQPLGEWRNVPSDTVRVTLKNGTWTDIRVDEAHYPNQIIASTEYGLSIQPNCYNTSMLIPEDVKASRKKTLP